MSTITTTTDHPTERPGSCGCGAPARGPVPADGATPEHHCRQCSAGHCRIAAFVKANQRA